MKKLIPVGIALFSIAIIILFAFVLKPDRSGRESVTRNISTRAEVTDELKTVSKLLEKEGITGVIMVQTLDDTGEDVEVPSFVEEYDVDQYYTVLCDGITYNVVFVDGEIIYRRFSINE